MEVHLLEAHRDGIVRPLPRAKVSGSRRIPRSSILLAAAESGEVVSLDWNRRSGLFRLTAAPGSSGPASVRIQPSSRPAISLGSEHPRPIVR